MKKIQRFLSGWSATYRQQGCAGKVILVVFSFLFFCVLCGVSIAVLSPSTPTSEAVASTPVDVSSLQTAAVETAFAGITQTAIANVPTQTFTPSMEPPTFTATFIATSTLEQLATLTSLGVSCVPSTTKQEEGLVAGIVDGDTIDVIINGQNFRVRYIGIDTPEKNGNLYWQATATNQELVYNKKVLLVNDVSETDRYGRILRYVFVDNIFVNYELVRQGYALASTYPPDVACSEFFANAQNQAHSAQVGLWASTPTPPSTDNGGNGSNNSSNCNPSYPDVCLQDGIGDYDCAGGSGNGPNYVKGPFRVLPPDPFDLDRDKDGIGCE